ncbi:MotA/TolQ/ExbB proton channel family protein [Emcibacter sp. SYSU 3D8]|uniref:MotA/TolQ/ExbB proton channel family protein n=1 Tax=Emcibacter sp. SYSU 3D8 TaxID=3133969 RepID=UPI0031FE62A8
MNNLSHFLAQADFIARFILVLMAVASATSWYLIVTKAVSARRMRRRSEAFLDFFWNAPSLEAVAKRLEDVPPQEPFALLAYQGILASRHHQLHGTHRLKEAGTSSEFITRSLRKVIDDETTELETGLTVLASIGATAPFVGLLGTVWGIYHALTAIGLSGAGTLDKVAGPVGEALIMTALGLAVAIPAVLGYNYIVRNNRLTLTRLDGFAHDLFAFLTTGARLDDQMMAPVARQTVPAAPAAVVQAV